ncbi:MAG: HAD hydrolase family protein [Gemmatimonadales bacterium]|nr:HAD hydrolase family protein [Gemmatimonadales bacterium]NIN11634.1 HAD hydrolase family protein [Gemmatimonadales bacterium]NIN50240.1 HAD hydrolase family protein [Gemmatimonadales bacterium]NIP07704.1 HAD hydrolase family protein [Gemmatimonadales bacterium]NIR01856.1 HAD hydrolase family protein [Gemmatimonadales bacterium]
MVEPLIAKRIRVVGFDVDGVMTDGGVYVGTVGGRPVELKRFDIQDNVGVKLLRDGGIKVVVVSGRVSEATRLRAEELQVHEVAQDNLARKLPAFEGILLRMGLRMEEAAFMGDDLPDLPILKRVALPVAVANARPEVRQVAQYTTQAIGGHGAVREFAEALLRSRGEWDELVGQYLSERGEGAARSAGVP